ncbi:TPA: DnaD domain protein, partial [Candidatus Avacholeplasma faecigallinarum]|nr:DnaD domain protein [Candidatus Avacholeplasma faecigallinarum]
TSYLEKTSADVLLDDIVPNYPEKYLQTINDIYANIELPRGVLNCMIIKVLKEKGGDLPSLNYFKKMSETWIKDNVFTTVDAIKYVTTFNVVKSQPKNNTNLDDGWEEL